MVRAMSDSDRPSDVKGSGQPGRASEISQESRQTAQQAADAAGVPLGAWLSRVIKNVSATELGRAGRRYGLTPFQGEEAVAFLQRLGHKIGNEAAGSDLGRIGALYGLTPASGESAQSFRGRLTAFGGRKRDRLGGRKISRVEIDVAR